MSSGGVGWERVERDEPHRSPAAGAVHPEPGEADPEQVRRILEDRARSLAREPADPTRRNPVTLVSAVLGGERWAVDARLVWEVFRLVDFTPLPGASAPVTGIAPWRGSVLTVLDLRSVLGMSARALADLNYAMVVGEEGPAFGILVDSVGEVVELESDEIGEPPEGVAPHREYVRGVTSETLCVLDVSRLLRERF